MQKWRKVRGQVGDTQAAQVPARHKVIPAEEPGKVPAGFSRPLSPRMQKKISKEEMTRQTLQRDKEMDEQINVNQIRVCNDDETVAALPGFLREKVQDEVRMKIKGGVMRITSEGLLELVPKNKDLKLPPRVPGQIREEDHACQGSTDGGGGVGASALKTEKIGQAAQDPSRESRSKGARRAERRRKLREGVGAED